MNKTFLEELSYKLWSTKGARFQAHNRLISKNNKSVSTVAFLTAYLIIFGLIGVYQNKQIPLFPDNIIGFGSMAGSILVLIFSQLEGMQDYKLKAHLYHTCALEISELYNQIRIRKTLQEAHEEKTNIVEFCDQIEKKYTDLLMKYPNHEEIDYKMFMVQKSKDYYKNIGDFQKLKWQFIYFLKNNFLYIVLILLPPILLLYFFFK
ncbi:MAG TPA: SLATT domain-containing protein [Leadbetterella sp.]|nr:SLATT domain-containing protein [Leadbetterella sp.]